MATNMEKFLKNVTEDDSDSCTSESEFEVDDGQLQKAFAKGLLKPGLNFISRPPKQYANDLEGLKDTLAEFRQNLCWIERLEITCHPVKVSGVAAVEENKTDNEDEDVEDYFKRELRFYKQGQAAVLEALPKLNRLNLSTKRPDDYFAEMAKSDAQMKKIREKLISRQLSMEKSEKAKKLRELRKFGKKVQQEVLQARQKDKTEMVKKLKKLTKGKMQETTEELKEQHAKGKKRKLDPKIKGSYNPLRKPTKKQQYKDAKFGFGGKKKRIKQNDKSSSHNDDDGFNYRKNRKDIDKDRKNRGGKIVRPGKNRRMNMKSKGKRRK